MSDVIEQLSKCKSKFTAFNQCLDSGYVLEAITAAISELKQLREDVARMPKWIEIEKQTPRDAKHYGGVLVARRLHFDPAFGEFDVTIGYQTASGEWRDDHGPIIDYDEAVTHWMMIPENPNIAAIEAAKKGE